MLILALDPVARQHGFISCFGPPAGFMFLWSSS
jgi:hypothetical protein